MQLKLGKGYASQVVMEHRTIHILDFDGTQGGPVNEFQFVHEGFVEYYGVPLMVKGERKGALDIYHRTPESRPRVAGQCRV